jgi:hypothetical protein
MTAQLGKLQRVDPRTIWKHEAHDFTPWLVENIEMLGELLGMELEVVEREADVGDFSVDILLLRRVDAGQRPYLVPRARWERGHSRIDALSERHTPRRGRDGVEGAHEERSIGVSPTER